MKSLTTSAILSVAALSSGSLAALSLDFAKQPSTVKSSRRSLLPRKDFQDTLGNNITAFNYMIQVQVGTPPQDVSLAIDTGSSDVWVLSTTSTLCSDSSFDDSTEGVSCQTPFNSGESSTFKVTNPNAFQITYGDQSGASGDYFTDILNLGGGESLTAQTMGIAYNATLSPGLLGIGYDTNEASEAEEPPFVYSSLIDSLVTQNLISLKAYSLYLNDLSASTGTLLFGGLDSDKYQGTLTQLDIIPDQDNDGNSVIREFNVAMTAFGYSPTPGNTTSLAPEGEPFNIPALLDSGTALIYLPEQLVTPLYDALSGAYDEESQTTFVPCSIRDSYPDLTFDFGFGTTDGVTIRVPVVELILDLDFFVTPGYQPDVPFSNPCGVGVVSSEAPYILGDTFLRSAYVVYDLKNNLIGLGQTNFDSTTSKIFDFSADATAIPQISGVAPSATIVETEVAQPTRTGGIDPFTSGGSGGIPSITPLAGGGLPTASGNPSEGTSKANAGSISSTPFDPSAVIFIGMSLGFAVLGGGLFLA